MHSCPHNDRIPHGSWNFKYVHIFEARLVSKNVKIEIYKSIILPVVLYECETSSLTLREEHTLSVLEKMLLRRIFGPRRNEVTGGWKRLHNEEL
jgi:hypothetical protein